MVFEKVYLLKLMDFNSFQPEQFLDFYALRMEFGGILPIFNSGKNQLPCSRMKIARNSYMYKMYVL